MILNKMVATIFIAFIMHLLPLDVVILPPKDDGVNTISYL